jgi:anthranilate phosphoribosyltransferase
LGRVVSSGINLDHGGKKNAGEFYEVNEMTGVIARLRQGRNLTHEEIEGIMREIMSGTAAPEDVGSFLLALRDKGPTVDEITGAARVMRQFVIPVKTRHETLLDTCGTGGDRKHTFNISTLVALVVSAAGVPVAKHGNRSVSSQCGSADILEGLGVNLSLDEKQLGQCLDEVGIAFLFAQRLHPAMKNVAPIRKVLGVETIFNVLGPLTNPANATHQMMGVYNRDLVEPLARVLGNLGLQRALVVHGSDGLDEITTTGRTFISEYSAKGEISYDIEPQELGIPLARLEDLTGGDLTANLQIFVDLIDGVPGPKADIVVLNAAYALYTAGKVEAIAEGIDVARETLMGGSARRKLEELKAFTHGIR